MKKCQNPDHPHCTQWVQPGAAVCGAGHAQTASSPASGATGLPIADLPATARHAILQSALVSPLPTTNTLLAPAAGPSSNAHAAYKTQAVRPHLHVSGFDPRAAGGRQSIWLHLHGIIAQSGAEIHMLARSELLPHHQTSASFVRGASDWRPVLLEFSSRGRVHGQYALELELLLRTDKLRRKWLCTLVILVPNPQASLAEVHQSYLATHKNVRIVAEDGSIAHLQGILGGADHGNLNLDIEAKNGGLAEVDLQALNTPGKQHKGFSSLAWDEDLLEVEHDTLNGEETPNIKQTACILPRGQSLVQHLRLFAMPECILGRWQTPFSEMAGNGAASGAANTGSAQLLLAHFNNQGTEAAGLTRRISAQHARICQTGQSWMIEDISRFGLLLDNEWPGKNKLCALRLGMQINLTHSFRDIVKLEVAALLPHLLLLQRCDSGRLYECFYILRPETRPSQTTKANERMPSGFPLLFHFAQAFWHRDPISQRETRLSASPGQLPMLADLAHGSTMQACAYPELADTTEPDLVKAALQGQTSA